MTKFPHIFDTKLRAFAEVSDPKTASWDHIVWVVDQLEGCVEADHQNEEIGYKIVDARQEAYDGACKALGERNRFEVQDAVQDFFSV